MCICLALATDNINISFNLQVQFQVGKRRKQLFGLWGPLCCKGLQRVFCVNTNQNLAGFEKLNLN